MPPRTRNTRSAAADAKSKKADKTPVEVERRAEPGPEQDVEASGKEPEEQEDEGGDGDGYMHEGGLRRLQFNEPISWRAGNPIGVADLLDRLERLANELRDMDQEETDTDSLTPIARHLAHSNLLGHKDKGIRAWTACCVVDVLRLCAPNAPYTQSQLKDIFTAIINSIIPSLADPSNAYNPQHVYVLSSLAEVKSIVLLTDLDSPDPLIIQIFSYCFDIVSGALKSSSGEPIAKNVEYDMIRLLVPIIDEAPVLHPEVVDVIMAQFMRVDPRAADIPTNGKSKKNAPPVDHKQSTLLPKEYPPAYNMAKAICNACPEKMTSYVSQYFNNVIVDASGASQPNGTKMASRRVTIDDSEEVSEDIKELGKAHRLIRELWRACPDVLQNVIPQLEAELSAESVSLRLLATQTIGDLAAGIGVSGLARPSMMDPATYPPITLNDDISKPLETNMLLTPLSPKPFPQAHYTAYQSFLSRKIDRSASVRAAWATEIGRILLTSAGGIGLSANDEQDLVRQLTAMLSDADERVRLAAVEVVGTFGFSDIINKIGANGGVSDSGSLLSVLSERVKDRKHVIREQATKILARMWAVAAGEIEADNELVVPILKDIPTRIFDAFYTNDREIHVLIDHVLFDILIPLNYPPIKSKSRASQQPKKHEADDIDPDYVRVRRILVLGKNLDERAKKVFIAFLGRQVQMRTWMTFYLTSCDEYNGGVIEHGETEIKAKMTKIVDGLSNMLPDSSKASADLWKFAKMHDRRNYHLIRFAMSAVNDYRTVTRAIRELIKRIQSNNTAPAGLLDTLIPLLYRCSSLILNRSHVPAVIELSRTDKFGLGNMAHEILREISTQSPEVLEAHVQEMCKFLEKHSPTEKNKDDAGAEEILKACAGFSRKLPSKLPSEREFMISLTNYAKYSSSPKAAKYAVTIIMAISDKKEMYAQGLIKDSITNCTFESKYFLTKLATISQLNLLAPDQADVDCETIISIATDEVLLKNQSPEPSSEYSWSDELDRETAAKKWALRILANRVRSKDNSGDDEGFRAYAEPVYGILYDLVTNEGELLDAKNTPGTQRPRLRLLAAELLLKLSDSKPLCDQMLDAKAFNNLALMAQDPLFRVRAGFIDQLKKRLSRTAHLGQRWYTITFLLAFEPNAKLREGTLTWLRSRASLLEHIAPRLLSLLAYHPDYPPDSLDEEVMKDELADFSRYILFYLTAVANDKNLSLIFHFMQRVKQAQDAITDSPIISERLYTLSDLAQATTRRFAEIYSQQHRLGGSGPGTAGTASILQTYPGKARLPTTLFSALTSHTESQTIASTNYLPPGVDSRVERLVRALMKPLKPSTAGRTAGRKRKVDSAVLAESGDEYEGDHGHRSGSDSPKRAKKEKGQKQKSKQTRALPVGKSKPKPKSKSRRTKGSDDEEEGGWRAHSNKDTQPQQGGREREMARRGAKVEVSYAEVNSDEDEEMEDADDVSDDESEEEEEENEGKGGEDDEAAGATARTSNDDGDSDAEGQDEDHVMFDSKPEVQISPVPKTRRRGRPAKGSKEKTKINNTKGRGAEQPQESTKGTKPKSDNDTKNGQAKDGQKSENKDGKRRSSGRGKSSDKAVPETPVTRRRSTRRTG